MSETLTPTILAAQLHGRDRRIGITEAECEQAKAHGLVIAYGASDDTLVFGGAIEDEVAAWGGAVVPLGPNGVGDTGPSRFVEALWDEDADTVWTILTSIPHAEFVLMGECEPWCRGIVFRLADTGAAESPPPSKPTDPRLARAVAALEALLLAVPSGDELRLLLVGFGGSQVSDELHAQCSQLTQARAEAREVLESLK